MKISTTFLANLVTVLVFVLPVLGMEVFDQGTALDTVTKLGAVATTLYVFYGRYKAGGINAFGFRVKK